MRPRVHSFHPISTPTAQTLILGSMPGVASLKATQYYAHPQNAFWRIMGELYGFDPRMPYGERLLALTSRRIALWDVLKSCKREGSLDSDIQEERPNDFRKFFRDHPKVSRVFFNGAKAEQCFLKHVNLGSEFSYITFKRLPSTSPAHAGMSFEKKLKTWRLSLTKFTESTEAEMIVAIR